MDERVEYVLSITVSLTQYSQQKESSCGFPFLICGWRTTPTLQKAQTCNFLKYWLRNARLDFRSTSEPSYLAG